MAIYITDGKLDAELISFYHVLDHSALKDMIQRSDKRVYCQIKSGTVAMQLRYDMLQFDIPQAQARSPEPGDTLVQVYLSQCSRMETTCINYIHVGKLENK